MTQPLLHHRTKTSLENYLTLPTHGLILAGPEGSGKYFLALWLAKQLSAENFTLESADQKNSITIDQIRDLYGITRTGSSLTIIVKDAQQMGREAENAFLKLLEEPPQNTRFILTTNKLTSLLPTIRSRSQAIEVLPPPAADLLSYATKHTSIPSTELKSLLHTSRGLPGTFINLLLVDSSREAHLAAVKLAKQFYGADPYNRHLLCVQYKFEKEWASQLLDLLSI